VIIDTAVTLSVILITYLYVKNKLNISIKYTKTINSTLLKEIFSYTIWTFIFSIVIQLQWNTGQIILGIQKNTVIVAVYGLGIILAGYYSVFASSINSMLLPKASNMFVDCNVNSKMYTDEMIKIGRINLFVLLFILSGFFLFGKFFIKLWVGDFYIKSWLIALIIMVSLTLQIVQAFGNILLDAMKKTKFKSILTLSTISLSLIFSLYFSTKYSLLGVVIPLGVAIFLNSVILNIYYSKVFGLERMRFFKHVFFKPLFAVSLLTIIVHFLTKDCIVDNWYHLITIIVVYSLFFIFTIYLIMNEQERKHIKFRI
jgi:O-antigen/teichoic acid export membrane protein